MLCDICGKKQATVHLTEIIEDQMSELHLCDGCARDKGAQMEKHFGFSDLLAGLAGIGPQLGPAIDERLKCPNCGMSYQNFISIGQLGCGECYKAFKKNLVPLLKRIHGSTQYMGKMPLALAGANDKAPAQKPPKALSAAQQMQELKARLQKAIEQEEFEEAARLRDKIKELESREK